MSLHPCVNHVTLDNEARPYERIDGNTASIANLVVPAVQFGGVWAPPYEPGRWYAVGAAFMAARTGLRFPPHPRRTS